ncbi:hypothetical protein PG994_001841 [Apiospora phragmitis]|uniref:Uncharacterized protein n=1 Tax=Apiospora phragmitis TaxID=2905665 RepID=A0ABR1WUT6_9PEZI
MAMLRLPPTAISVTMTEVKDFEHRRRFKRYLTRQDAPTRRSQSLHEHSDSEIKESLMATPQTQKPAVTDERGSTETPKRYCQPDTPKLFSLPPRRPPKLTPFPSKVEAPTSHEASRSSQSTSPYASSLWQGPNSSAIRLPPPFSVGVRRVSDELSLPFRTFNQAPPNHPEELARDPPMMRFNLSSVEGAQTETIASVPAEGGSNSFLYSANHSVESAEHSLTRTSVSHSASETRRDDGGLGISQETMGTDPGVRVYNDSLPASLQPQTPRNLPEARHQSRLHGPHTAPVPRVASRSAHHPRRHYGRARSPSGMEAPGFRGLFGGAENSDESARFSNEE